MDKIQATKDVAKTVVSWSTGFAIGSALGNATTPKNNLQKAEVVVASYVLGQMVGDLAAEYTDKQIDSFVVWWKKNVRKDSK